MIAEPLMLACLLFGLGVIFIVAELFLPTHGLLGVLGALGVLGGIAACFWANPWLGLGTLILLVVISPFAGILFVKLYPRTPLGRRMILAPIQSRTETTSVKLGQVGTAASELRPVGVCDFGDQRVEVIAEHGLVPPGTPVQIVAIINNRPTVRVLKNLGNVPNA